MTSTSFTLVVNSRSNHRFLSAITFLQRSVGEMILDPPPGISGTAGDPCGNVLAVP
jgi:hypothetical protein